MQAWIAKVLALVRVAPLLATLISAPAFSFETKLVPNTVKCPQRSGYDKPVTTYCGLADYALLKPHFMVEAVEQAIAGEPVLQLHVALFAFADLNSANRLCSLLSGQTSQVTVSAQKDTQSDNTLASFEKCAAMRGAQLFKSYLHGLKIGGINSFHPKLVYIETASRKIALIGSGNLSSGRRNVDYVVLTVAPKDKPPESKQEQAILERVEWASCMLSQINNPAFDSLRETIVALRATCYPFAPSEQTYALPPDARRLLSSMGFYAGQASVLRIVSQGFNSSDVEALVRLGVREGRSVRIILDDDMYWANIYPNKDLMNEQYEYIEHLLPLIKMGAEVRFMITNHNDNIGNFQHAKGYSFASATGSTAFLGSANSTYSALSDNLETMIQVSGTLSQEFDAWFDELWDRAIPHERMPLQDPLAK